MREKMMISEKKLIEWLEEKIENADNCGEEGEVFAYTHILFAIMDKEFEGEEK
jgi:hypothetical protein